ncbi:SDR family NAD(P)-dependent oxidoreductase [Phenylobacterium deserti]|uniref:NAD-dependent oxidoreductase n=1 Tax=Phenylobacterium deserti TaxID=1914756 RepID=A0A328AEY4_9CAUL|nr:SDR family NAD(P)-dependent oxidoreductase [Phenylobacterium deserti]RAK51348.1 NAD-dependent oxidoreductase [Phenylobacterium deserti]
MAGRIVAVTGASGALGSVVARAAVERGWRVALIDHGREPPPGFTDSEDVLVVRGVDLTDAEQAMMAVQAVVSRFGGLDAVLNIAGGFRWEAIDGGSSDTWDRLYRLNVLTALHASRAAIPHLKASGSGRIVNVGANGAVKAAHGMGAYAASKAGVHRLTEALAEELKADGVTVNAVLPSIIDTPANRGDMPDADFGAWVRPEDLAAVILFLASEEARAVTGALVPVTGRV